MTQTQKELINKISMLSENKLIIAKTFIDFLEQQKETENLEEITTKKPFSRSRGVFKGKIWMSEDFDEPLEEMKEYME